MPKSKHYYKLSETVTYHSISKNKGILLADFSHHIVNGSALNEIFKSLGSNMQEDRENDNKNIYQDPLFFYAIDIAKKIGALETEKNERPGSLFSSIQESPVGPTNGIYILNDLTIHQSPSELKRRSLAGQEYTCIITDSYLNPKLHKTIKSQGKKRIICIAKIIGSELWIGPFLPATSPIWKRIFHRIQDNFPTEHYIALTTGKSPTASRQISAEQETIAANFISDEAFTQLKIGNKTLFTQPRIITLNYETKIKSNHVFITKSQRHLNKTPETLSIRSIDGGRRSISANDLIELTRPIIDPITGIIPKLNDIRTLAGANVTTTIQITPYSYLLKENRRLGSKLAAAGKGETIEQARASCIGEAIERYSTSFQGNEKLTYSSMDALGNSALDPRSLMLYSESQYENRDWWNREHGFFHFVPEKFNPSETIAWTECKHLITQNKYFIPSAYIYFNFHQHNPSEPLISVADSNGCASGYTIVEAQIQALYELIERDACAIWWYNRLRMPAIDTKTFDSNFISNSKLRYESYQRELIVLDLTSDLGIPVVLATSFKLDGTSICVGLGCHRDMKIAVSRAIAELDQFVAMFGLTVLNDGNQSGNRELDTWLSNESIYAHPYFTPIEGPLRKYIPPPLESISEELWCLTSKIESTVGPVFYVDLTRPETPLRTAKIIVPGLRHFWARLAPGRLYDAPVKMGYRNFALHENELNPIPFFL